MLETQNPNVRVGANRDNQSTPICVRIVSYAFFGLRKETYFETHTAKNFGQIAPELLETWLI